MNCRVSIIVPVYNVECYIHRCINSILNQTFKNFELILVDDGSYDNSGNICDQYAIKDNRVVVIHKQNGGLSSARNKGIEVAKCDYIAFIDSDDFIHPQMFQILYSNVKIYNSDLALCNYKEVYENEVPKFESYDIENLKTNIYTNIQSLEELQGSKGTTYVVAWNKLYKKQLFESLSYKDGKIHEDEFIIHEILYKCKRVSYVSVDLYYYLQRCNSITKSKFNVSRLDGLDAYIERILFYKKINETKLMCKAEITYVIAFFKYYDKLKNEVENPKEYIKMITNKFRRRIFGLIKNNYLTYKEKVALISFCINPIIYEKYKKLKNGGL